MSDTRSFTCEMFEKTYKRIPERVDFTPYRICPIGAHSDHQLGKITGLALDKGIYFASTPDFSGNITVSSVQFPVQASWNISNVPAEKQYDWADYLRGATLSLGKRYNLSVGLCGLMHGELPIGGLSSSAAIIISYVGALSHLNGISLKPREMVYIAWEAEFHYVGVFCGRLDQSCEVYGRKDKLLYLDTKDDSYELIDSPSNMKPYDIVVFYSGIERCLYNVAYNMHVVECREAAFYLKKYAGMKQTEFPKTNLREVPYEVYLQFKDRLKPRQAKRAEHWFSEFKRVEAGAEAWRAGDIEEYGRLCFESGLSSIVNWETGSPELIELYELMRDTMGVYGGRFSGAGFHGCCIALINPEFTDEAIRSISEKYLRKFHSLEGQYSAHICHSADGVIL